MIKLSIKKYSKLGVLGGTFDPPHKGHLHISKIALKKFKLDKLFWVVTRKNLFKGRPYLDKKIRIKLSKKITEKERKIHVQYRVFTTKYMGNRNIPRRVDQIPHATNL